jgi:hypothetical protein
MADDRRASSSNGGGDAHAEADDRDPPAGDLDSDVDPDEQILPGWPGERTTSTPDEEQSTFALVGNEIRAEIIKTLGDARGQEGARPILSFSELHDRVDVEVVSSQFNYHLQQLVDSFVDQTENGYRLRPEGSRLYRLIRAGTVTERTEFGPVDVGFDCYHCGTPVEGVYQDSMFTVQCRGCETLYDLVLASPGTLDPDDDDDLLERIDQYTRHRRLAFSRGVCPVCLNDIDTKLIEPGDSPFDEYQIRDVEVHQSCGHCGSQMYVGVGAALLYDPALVSFCYERGRDVTSEPIWHLEFAMTDRSVDVRSRDPWTVALEVTMDGDALELVVDGELNVLERNYV